eukprot:GHVR01079579.1.p2 GENE.GHVR01079579.1~~GHVR01079579.1.p2  ORF type:complete len:101 (-),score=2.76 GHVR01079579.1:6443-6745(-)
MSLVKNALITSKNKNTFLHWTSKGLEKNSINMIIFVRKHTDRINLNAIMFGHIMFAQFGFHNATLKKRMDLSASKVSKISIKKDSKPSVKSAKKVKMEHV